MLKMSVIKKELEATWNRQPFKNYEEMKTEIRDCDRFAGISQYACFMLASLGAIGDASNATLVLQSMSWFLLAIVAGLNAIIGHNHVVVTNHLFGIKAESKKRVVNSNYPLFLVFIAFLMFYAFELDRPWFSSRAASILWHYLCVTSVCLSVRICQVKRNRE
jgi:hypothetical protein